MATMKVKPWGEEQGSHVVIEEEDFDENFHKKFSDAELAKIEKDLAKAEAADEGEEPGEGNAAGSESAEA